MELDPFEQDLVENLPVTFANRGNILVVSGTRGAGKSAGCQALIDRYRRPGRKIAGILTPGRFDQGQKTGYFALDLAGGASRLFASRVTGEIDGLRFGHWVFDPAVFEWGNQCLRQASDADILVVDELGFLEFDLHTGWTAGLETLQGRDYRLALVVIRPECIEPFANLGFQFQVKTIEPLPGA